MVSYQQPFTNAREKRKPIIITGAANFTSQTSKYQEARQQAKKKNTQN